MQSITVYHTSSIQNRWDIEIVYFCHLFAKQLKSVWCLATRNTQTADITYRADTFCDEIAFSNSIELYPFSLCRNGTRSMCHTIVRPYSMCSCFIIIWQMAIQWDFFPSFSPIPFSSLSHLLFLFKTQENCYDRKFLSENLFPFVT